MPAERLLLDLGQGQAEPETDEDAEGDPYEGEKPAPLPEHQGMRRAGAREVEQPPQARPEESEQGDADREPDAGGEGDEPLLPPGTRDAALDLERVEHRVDAARREPHEHHRRHRRNGPAVPLGHLPELRSDELARGGGGRADQHHGEIPACHREAREDEASHRRERQKRKEEPERHLGGEPERARLAHAAPDSLDPVDDDPWSVVPEGAGL